MNIESEMQKTCHILIESINEYFNKSKNGLLSFDELIDEISYLKEKELKSSKNDSIGTLFELIHSYIKGKVSNGVLNLYLEKQFLINKTEREKFLTNLKILCDQIGCIEKTAILPSRINHPKVSVIITTYNRKNYLKQAIESFLQQDYPNIEIIVIDDYSNDGTENMMEEIYATQRKVIYMRNAKNMGPGNNRRIAFNAFADGEYVLFFDDDDYLVDMNYISKAVNFHIKHHDVSFVAANVFFEYSRTNQFKTSSLNFNEVINGEKYFMRFEKPGYPKPASTLTTLFKREALIKMNLVDMKMVNDASIYLRSLLVGDAGFIDVIAGVYRIHGDNITFSCSREFIVQNLEEKMDIKNMAIEQYRYDQNQMDDWFDYNAHSTISYFLVNSAKDSQDFNYMFDWVHKNCPRIHKKLRHEISRYLLKRKLRKFGFIFNSVRIVRSVLNNDK